MAVTILTRPNDFSPSGNPITWTFSSDQTAQANFSYLVEIYVNGQLRNRETRFPEDGIKAKFNASSYAERFCNSPIISNDLSTDASNTAELSIKIIERYGNPIADGADITSTQITVYKAKLTDADFIAFDSNDYVLKASNVDFVSLFPVTTDTYKCGNDEQARLLLLSGDNCDEVTITLLDSTGSPTGVSDSVAVSLAKTIMFSIGPQQLITGTTITQANLDAAASYTVVATDTVGGFSTNPFTIEIDRRCRRDTSKRLHFISTIGSIESFSYTLYSNESGSIESKSYDKRFGQWNGNAFEYNLINGRSVDYQKIKNSQLLLRSNWLTQGEQNWLEAEVAVSPLVLIEDVRDPSVGLRRVRSTKSRYVFKTTKQDTKFREDLVVVLERFTSMTL
jgi:hypothetical protein